jgi:hypothetical protein
MVFYISENSAIPNLIKIRSAIPVLLHAYGRTDRLRENLIGTSQCCERVENCGQIPNKLTR